MADTATDALLMQIGERVHGDAININVRNNLLKLVGEDAQKRIVASKEATSEIIEVELPTLEAGEQDLAKLQIMEMHPLADLPFYEAFPNICCFLRLCASSDRKPKDSEKLKKEVEAINDRLNMIIKNADGAKYEGTNFKRDLAKKFGLSWPKKDGSEGKKKEKQMSQEEKNSPFAEYGFGIKAWISTLRYLFQMYLVISLFAYAMMSTYASSKFNGLEPPNNTFGKLAKYSLGNIGFTSSLCFFQFAKLNKPMDLSCKKGKLSGLHHKGVISSVEDLKLVDGSEFVGHDFCGDHTLLPPESDCSSILKEEITAEYEATCKGKESCKMDMTQFLNQGPEVKDTCKNQFTQIYI